MDSNGDANMTAGVVQRHQLLVANTLAALHAQLGGECRLSTNTFGVVAERDGSILVIDIFIPSMPDFASHKRVFGYRQNPEIKHILLIDPDRPQAILHSRCDGWESRMCTSVEAAIELPAVGATLVMSDIYRGVEIETKG